MTSKLIRTEKHALATTPEVRSDVQRTIAVYRRAVRLLATVALTHWPELGPLRSKERLTALEALVHPTKLRPQVRYAALSFALGKMPSYLRRAALNAALGAASSFLSNYSNWLDDAARERGSRPPRFGVSNVFPSLYGGNMILVSEDLRTVRLKLLDAHGLWRFSEPLSLKGRLKRLTDEMALSPSLMSEGAHAWLSCPVQVKRKKFIHNKHVGRVCAVDVGINNAAVAAVVDSTGTVIARKFLTCARHNDQRERLSVAISKKQAQSHGAQGRRMGRGFCKSLFRRIAGLSLEAARTLASELVAWARAQGAQALVLEDLKGWKPKGRGTRQRQRFHRFQHRMLVKYIVFQAEEHGLRVLHEYARGTSAYAYDGSGLVKRDRENMSLATFSNGRRYHADLNAAYNIAARGLARMLGVEGREKEGRLEPASGAGGKSSAASSRMPIVLADIWAYARASAVAP
jgi:IS605 OrfB family transposase